MVTEILSYKRIRNVAVFSWAPFLNRKILFKKASFEKAVRRTAQFSKMDQLRSFRFSSSLKTKLFCSVRQNPKSLSNLWLKIWSGLVLQGNELIFFFQSRYELCKNWNCQIYMYKLWNFDWHLCSLEVWIFCAKWIRINI